MVKKSNRTWIGKLSEDDLLALMSLPVARRVDNPDEAARFIEREACAIRRMTPSTRRRLAKKKTAKKVARRNADDGENVGVTTSLWQQIKLEFYKLVCTNDAKYKDLRKRLSTYGQDATVLILASIAARISAIVGVAVGVVAKFCTLALLTLLRLGKEAFCARFGGNC